MGLGNLGRDWCCLCLFCSGMRRDLGRKMRRGLGCRKHMDLVGMMSMDLLMLNLPLCPYGPVRVWIPAKIM